MATPEKYEAIAEPVKRVFHLHAAMGNPGYSTAQVEEALCRWIDSKHPLARYEINLVTRLIGIDMSDANSSEFSTGKETRPKHRRSGTILSRNKDGYDIRPLQCLSTLRLCDDENVAVENLPRTLDSIQNLHVHVYTLNTTPPIVDINEGQNVANFRLHTLPHGDFEGLWNSLVFPRGLKQQLLDYAHSALFFADLGVDSQLIAWNRLILLHGPPGTGKTSLCKALAHRLAIQMDNRYDHAVLLEVNAHSLFSKWFSESGKLVQQLFDRVHNMLFDGHSLVVVLIDEVESLAGARESCMGTEPSDSIRVVNALLTQIDGLKQFPNALVLTTSNITAAIDTAFKDRADLQIHIGPPCEAARYSVLSSCILELIRVGAVFSDGEADTALLSYTEAEVLRHYSNKAIRPSLVLLAVAKETEGVSGRSLRKLPFLAHSRFFQVKNHNERTEQ